MVGGAKKLHKCSWSHEPKWQPCLYKVKQLKVKISGIALELGM